MSSARLHKFFLNDSVVHHPPGKVLRSYVVAYEFVKFMKVVRVIFFPLLTDMVVFHFSSYEIVMVIMVIPVLC